MKLILQYLNAVCFVVIALAGYGSLSKPPGYAADSLLYHLSLILLGGTYFINYWSLQQQISMAIVKVSVVLNSTAFIVFLIGGSDKLRGSADLWSVIGLFAAAVLTVLHLHRAFLLKRAGVG